MKQQQPIMHKVRPFWGRILVLDSPVDEEQTESGLIVPVQSKDNPELTRAIVIQHDPHYAEHPDIGYPHTELLPIGTVIWYITTLGKKIGDVVAVDVDDIWAYEEG